MLSYDSFGLKFNLILMGKGIRFCTVSFVSLNKRYDSKSRVKFILISNKLLLDQTFVGKQLKHREND